MALIKKGYANLAINKMLTPETLFLLHFPVTIFITLQRFGFFPRLPFTITRVQPRTLRKPTYYGRTPCALCDQIFF